MLKEAYVTTTTPCVSATAANEPLPPPERVSVRRCSARKRKPAEEGHVINSQLKRGALCI